MMMMVGPGKILAVGGLVGRLMEWGFRMCVFINAYFCFSTVAMMMMMVVVVVSRRTGRQVANGEAGRQGCPR